MRRRIVNESKESPRNKEDQLEKQLAYKIVWSDIKRILKKWGMRCVWFFFFFYLIFCFLYFFGHIYGEFFR